MNNRICGLGLFVIGFTGLATGCGGSLGGESRVDLLPQQALFVGNLATFFDRTTYPSSAYAISNNLPDFQVTMTSFTLSLWAKNSSTSANDCLYMIEDTSGPRHLKLYYTSGTNLRAELMDGGTIPLNTTSITPSNWNHIVFSWDVSIAASNPDGKAMRLYVNGAKVADYDLSAGSLDWDLGPGGHIEIAHCGSNFANTTVDDVSFWDVGLSAAEVAAIYNSGSRRDVRSNFGAYTSSSHLKHFYWMGDADSSTTIYDRVGDGNLSVTSGTYVSAGI